MRLTESNLTAKLEGRVSFSRDLTLKIRVRLKNLSGIQLFVVITTDTFRNFDFEEEEAESKLGSSPR